MFDPRPYLVLLLTALLASSSMAADTTQETAPPDYSAFTQSYHLPFSNKKIDFNHLTGMNVRISINGGEPMPFQVDTGSCGVIVGASQVPGVEPKGPAGNIRYSSSGNGFDGFWTPVTLTFPDAKDENGNVATAQIPVLIVTKYVFTPGAVNSGGRKVPTSRPNPKVYMLGIGTGRGPESHQEQNPWVNLKEMQAGTMRKGYIIGRDGITLGLTKKAVGDGFLYEKLTQHVGVPTTRPTQLPPGVEVPKDWDSSRGWVTVGDQRQEDTGMLLDTGLTNLMIELPERKEIAAVPVGTDVTVNLLSGRLHYTFKVGDKTDPVSPLKVNFTPEPNKPLVNTGLRALAIYDYLLDSDGGYLGLRPTAKHP